MNKSKHEIISTIYIYKTCKTIHKTIYASHDTIHKMVNRQ